MADESAEITADMLGSFLGDGAPTPPAEPAPPAPEPETPSAPPAEAAGDDDEGLTLEELDDRIQTNLRKVIADERAKETPADPDAEDDDSPPEVRALAAENKALKARLEAQEADAEAKRVSAIEADLSEQITTAARKYTMTAEEIKTATQFALDNPDLAAAWKFERIALRVMPELADRAKSPPVGRAAPEKSSGMVPPTANGAGAPAPFKPKATPGSYSDLTQHVLRSGEAAGLGKYE